MAAQKRALVVLAEGAEEMEAVITIDVLRRAGIAVDVAGLAGPGVVTCSRSVRIAPDVALDQAVGPYDAVVLPGGAAGTEKLAASAKVGELLRQAESSGQIVGAICAAAFALAKHEVFAGRRMTCHPSVHEIVSAHATLAGGDVVVDQNLVTAPGPGLTFDFALALVEKLVGTEKASEVARGMLLED
jgi:protein DJ-1